MAVLPHRPRIRAALRQGRHYRALAHMPFRVSGWPFFLVRYVTDRGRYPMRLRIRLRGQRAEVVLWSHHDVLTVNEIFCRGEYALPHDVGRPLVAVDMGANIGMATLYFLMRGGPGTQVYAIEPVPRNVERLRANLGERMADVHLREAAVTVKPGRVGFGVEDTGRYGGVGLTHDVQIEVEGVAIGDLLAEVVDRHGFIDLLKIDVESLENELLAAIPAELHRRIGTIFAEVPSTDVVIAGHRVERRYELAIWHPENGLDRP